MNASTSWEDVYRVQTARIAELERENAALREDKARLDWLAVSETWFDEPATESFTPETFRAAIDAARKEPQP